MRTIFHKVERMKTSSVDRQQFYGNFTTGVTGRESPALGVQLVTDHSESVKNWVYSQQTREKYDLDGAL